MAAADTFTVKITGKGGHGAGPHLTIDPIVTASHVVTALQTIISRNVNPLKTAVVTVASIHAGDAFNVIPADVEMKGTLRTFDSDVRDLVIERFTEVVNNVSLALGCQAEIEIKSITPAVVNDPGVTARIQQVARSLLTADTIDTQTTTMGAEDMAFILKDIPGCYFFIGSANVARHLDAPHHNAKFDFDESILSKAAGLMVASTLEFLG
jgi:amidohydrolase